MIKTKRITFLLVENENSGEKLEIILNSFCIENNGDMLIFNNETKLLNYLKCNRRVLDSFVHYIILFNLNPPLNNFIKVINEIKEDNDLKVIPIFIITSSIENKDIIKSYYKHVNSYIVKPKNTNELIKVLKEFKDFWFNIVTLPRLHN